MHTSPSARRRVTALVSALLAGSVLATPAVVALTSAGRSSEVAVVSAGLSWDGGRRGHTWDAISANRLTLKGHTWDRVPQYPAP